VICCLTVLSGVIFCFKSCALVSSRLSGATLIAPVVNYWWPGFPANLSAEAYYRQIRQDHWALYVAHHAPWLTYWWNTQKWFPASAVISMKPDILSRQDLELLPLIAEKRSNRVLHFLVTLFFSLQGNESQTMSILINSV
jgi:hypothetical protein